MKKLFIASLCVLVSGCGGSSTTVKDSPSPIDPSLTLGQNLSNRAVCSETNWDSYEDDMGREVVTFNCRMDNIGDYFTSRVALLKKSAKQQLERDNSHFESRIGYRERDVQEAKSKVAGIEKKLQSPEDSYRPFRNTNWAFDLQQNQQILSVLLDLDVDNPSYYQKTSRIFDSHLLSNDFQSARWDYYRANNSLDRAKNDGSATKIEKAEGHLAKKREEFLDAVSNSIAKVQKEISQIENDRKDGIARHAERLEADLTRAKKDLQDAVDSVVELELQQGEITAKNETAYQDRIAELDKWEVVSADETLAWYIDKETGSPIYAGSTVSVYGKDDNLMDEKYRNNSLDYKHRLNMAIQKRDAETYSEYYRVGGSWTGNSIDG